MDIPEHAPPRQHKTGRDGPDLFEDIMGKQRREQPQDSIFANNPFLDGLFDWMDSPEGQQSIEVRDVPDFPRNEVEEFLLDWIDMGYDPENYSQAQLDELDSLTERWVADHLQKAKASKKT